MLRKGRALQFDPCVGIEFAVVRLCADDQLCRQVVSTQPPVHHQGLPQAGVGVQAALASDRSELGDALGPVQVDGGWYAAGGLSAQPPQPLLGGVEAAHAQVQVHHREEQDQPGQLPCLLP